MSVPVASCVGALAVGSAASLTPSVPDVAVLMRHPDLLQRVLGEFPRVVLQQMVLVVQHLGSYGRQSACLQSEAVGCCPVKS